MKLQGKFYVILICLTAGMGGFLFGFDTAVISGAINFLREKYHLSPALEGWLMSSALLGCVFGAAIAGVLADKFGRKKILLVSALLFMVSSVGCADASNASVLIIARIVGGVGVGFAAMVAPMFISEIAPPDLRGRLVSLYQLAITLGILCSYLTNSALLNYATGNADVSNTSFLHNYLVTEVWRGMLGSNLVPSVVFFIFLLFVPESPRWLIKENQTARAEVILTRINGSSNARLIVSEIKGVIMQENGRLKQLLEPGIRIALIIGLVLPFLSQLTGITTVMYYAPAIFEKAGFRSGSAMGNASVIGFFNMIFTLVAIWKIDKWGRKVLLLYGFVGLSLALFIIGLLFNLDFQITQLLLAAFIFYIAVFAATLGPGVWVVISEIYPTKIRGRAMSVATLSLFMGSSFVTQTYPILRDSIGIGNVFLIYAVIMLPAIYFVKRIVPETKGKSLEEIEKIWKSEKHVKEIAAIDV